MKRGLVVCGVLWHLNCLIFLPAPCPPSCGRKRRVSEADKLGPVYTTQGFSAGKGNTRGKDREKRKCKEKYRRLDRRWDEEVGKQERMREKNDDL
jgi:hypothetical protein